jgi:predicted nucleotidyltransferase
MTATDATAGAATHPPDVVDEIVHRIVDAVHPLRIILFGSASTGTQRRNSDVDVLVVVAEGTAIRPTAQDLHVRMSGVPVPVDIVVATPSLLSRYGNSRGLIYREALRHGHEVYVARPTA